VTRLIDAAIEFDEPSWREAQRRAALEALRSGGMPDPADEVWRYAQLDGLDLDVLELASPGGTSGEGAEIGGAAPAAVITLDAGRLSDVRLAGVDGLAVVRDAIPDELGSLVGADDTFASMNLALTPEVVVLDVAEGATPPSPVVLLVRCPAGVSLPRLLVRLAPRSSLRILEHIVGADATLVAGVAEYVLGAEASLSVATVQGLGDRSWSMHRTRSSLGPAAAVVQTVVGLGAHYDRVRADCVLAGDGSSSTLHTAHVGVGDQVHDLRTMQDHLGRRTTSRLHSKAAVSGTARSIYSGLIRMQPGAKRADARQVNNSLVLSDGSHADAVPNLDILENDVQCTHASTVGPVDPEQRWYLESRGIDPTDAVQLIVEGFFAEVEGLLGDDVLAAQLRESITKLDATSLLRDDGATDR
jgi:Fe-S cluster assembly protein SufD